MRTDVKTIVRAALLDNASLVTLLGGQRIYQSAAPKADEYPRITFFEVDNRDSDFADDEAYASSIVVQIDIWSKSSTSTITGEVAKTMKAEGWSRSLAADQYEDGVQVHHKVLRYRTKMLETE
ncbi:DUF3168 domain-containing protein [Paenibacillus anaericanus]|uniref:DUF3168 domain-containing protein n=1 Tax=Paenibacillus anaericanus TaxID=170367 RepID=A0A3S1CBU9_9BACL|nr:DUF3168 domain-containing protein [Paenibacillus anaericanus]RUT48600.1 DUF3168 domain-containing protein [Paenibacillus anaericanus]